MECPNCYHKIPDFLVPSYLRREQMCPECMRYCHPKVVEEHQRAENEELKRHAQADQAERYTTKA